MQPIIKRKPSDLRNEYIDGAIKPDCISNSENSKLRFFIEYQQSNCFANCLIADIYDACGCLPYYYAPMANYTSLPVILLIFNCRSKLFHSQNVIDVCIYRFFFFSIFPVMRIGRYKVFVQIPET